MMTPNKQAAIPDLDIETPRSKTMKLLHFIGISGLTLAVGALVMLSTDLVADRAIPQHWDPGATHFVLTPLSRVERNWTITKTSGDVLNCEEIRAMDEVEQITDNSYCS